MLLARKIVLAITGLLLNLGLEASPVDVVPVVSASSTISSLSRYELANIFLGKTQRFSDGSLAIPIDQREDAPAREAFYAEFVGKSAAQLKAYWSKMIFTGRGRPPDIVENGDKVRQWVADNPGAIGYIERSLVDESVRILQVL